MKKKISQKLISVILSVVIIAMSMTVAFAATTLTASNVSQWPTLSYKNADGKMYFGQTVGDALIINDDEIVLDADGKQVAGHFEFIDPTLIPVTGTNLKAHIEFVPDDTESYTGFQKKRSSLLYNVETVTPVFVDEVNDPLVASKVEVGSTLRTSTFSGGKMTNPYNSEEPNILARKWEWSNPDTVVTESGYYEAKFTPSGYTETVLQVYVAINVEIIETAVSETPSVPEITYDGVTTWADVALAGGLAVEKDTTTAVEGTFAITDSWKRKVIESGSYEIDAIFTPNDTEVYTKAEFKIPVTVNKGIVKFVDENGNDIVPEITIDRVLEVGDDLNGYLRPYLNASCSFNYEETEGYGEKIKPGTHEYTVKTIIDNPNYERYGTLTFKIVLNKEKVNAKVKNVVGGKQIYFEGGDVIHIYGDFDIKCFVDGKETQVIEGVKLHEAFTVNQSKSGVYTYEIIYNAAENDYYDVTVVTEAEEIKLQHSVKINDNEPVVYTYGETVTITAPAHEKPYYVFTGWANESGITLTDDQRSAESISTTMPDNDIELKANYKFSLKLFFEWIWAQIVQFFNYIINAVKGLFALAA